MNCEILNLKCPYVIGVAGGTGSGKTTLCNNIIEMIKLHFNNPIEDNIVLISQDGYYKGGDKDTNYDVPEAIDFDLLDHHLNLLLNGTSIDYPIYDFITHKRKAESIKLKPAKIIIIEGILIFTQQKILDKCNMKIFISAGIPTMIFRRIRRDINERGRTFEEIEHRYLRDIEDSYAKYVAPSERYANFIINNHNGTYTSLDMILHYLKCMLALFIQNKN